MIKSPLRYPGGKSRAVKLISTLIPPFEEFREPFIGGGSVYLYAKQKYPEKIYWINDLYSDLYRFWDIAQRNINALVDIIWEWKTEYNDGKLLYNFLTNNFDQFDNIRKAAAFFIFNRITFSGTTLSGGYSQESYIGRFTKSSIERLLPFNQTIQNTKITNLDYSELVLADGNNVFIFLDPPYYSATKSSLYGKNGNFHKNFDHQRFAEIMKQCNHKWLITYDDCEYIRELFDFANIVPWNLKYGMRNITEASDQNGKELFISNYNLPIVEQINNIQLTLFNE